MNENIDTVLRTTHIWLTQAKTAVWFQWLTNLYKDTDIKLKLNKNEDIGGIMKIIGKM